MEKLKKIGKGFIKLPQMIIHLLVIISSAYSNVPTMFQMDELMNEFGLDSSLITMNSNQFAVFAFIVGAFITWGILELILKIINNLVRSRRFIEPEKIKEFNNTVRLGYIVTQLLIGSYGMLNFLKDDVMRLSFQAADGTARLLVNGIVFTFVFLVLKNDVIKGDKVFSIYKYFFNLYLIIQFLSKGLDFISNMISIGEVTMASIVFSSINLAIVILGAGILYIFVYKKAREEQIKYIANQQAEFELNPPRDDIFTGYDI